MMYIWLAVLVGVVCCAGAVYAFGDSHKESNIHATSNDSQRIEEALPPHDVLPIPTADIAKKQLSNGMTILACRMGSAPKVLVQIGYDVGSSIEGDGERGLAHLLEHMIFKGTLKLSEGDIDAIARKYGAEHNAFTSTDLTSYYFEADKNNWRPFLLVLADCMRNVRFDEQHLASEIKAVIQELRKYSDSYWDEIWQHVFATVFPDKHPYHHPVIGYKEDLADINSARLKAFYDKYYQPSRAVLCIVGDIDPQEAIAAAEEQFAGIPSGGSDATPPFIPMPQPLKSTNVTIYRELPHEQIALFWHVPGRRHDVAPIAEAVQYVLGTGEASRLNIRLVDELKIAASVGVSVEECAAEGLFLIGIEPKEGQRDACIAAAREVLKELVRDGVNERELYKMVKHRQRMHMQWRFDLQHFAYNWLDSFFSTRDETALLVEPNRYATVTSAQVQEYAGTFLASEAGHCVIVAPLAEKQLALWHEQLAANEAYYEELLAHHQRTAPLEEPRYVHTLPSPTSLQFTFPKPTRIARVLNDSLTVISYQSKNTPLVSAALMFKDAAYFTRAKEGLAIDLMMGLLQEQNQTMNKEQIVDLFDLHGALYSFSDRGASITCGAASFGAIFAHTLKVLLRPSFSEPLFEKQRSIMVQSLEQGMHDANRVAQRLQRCAIYGKGHPYSWTFEEGIAYLQSLTLDDMRKMHSQYVRPDHMVVSVAGDLEPSTVEASITAVATGWEPNGYRPPVFPIDRTHEVVQLTNPLARDQVVLGLSRPSAVKVHDPEYLALDLLGTICFYDLGSRLLALRERTGLFYHATGAWATGIHQEHGYDSILLTINPDKISFAMGEVMNMLQQVIDGGVTEEEVASAKQIYLKDMIDVTTDPRSIAMMFANIETLGLGYDYYDTALQRINTITAKEISAIARTYASTSGFSRVIVGTQRAAGEPEASEDYSE